jgi:hypothetical protein
MRLQVFELRCSGSLCDNPTHQLANEYLQQECLPEHNQRFTRALAAKEDYQCKAPGAAELRKIFRLESEGSISNDWGVRYDNRFFQLQAQSGKYAPAKGRVVVCQWQDGTIEIEYRGQKQRWWEIARAAPQRHAQRPGSSP